MRPRRASANRMAAEALRALLAGLPSDRTIRILEIGAGTGATSEVLLPLLPPDRAEYVFTDLSKLFLQRAAERFTAYPFVRYELLNLESPPGEQGFADGQFDLIVAVNVVHATQDITVSLGNIRQLLAPGRNRADDRMHGPAPLDGHHLRADRRLVAFYRPSITPRPSADRRATWQRVFGENGFVDADAQPLQQPNVAPLRPSAPRGTQTGAGYDYRRGCHSHRGEQTTAEYLIFADALGIRRRAKAASGAAR